MVSSYINKIINENCIIGMKKIDDNICDACITDPPYNYEFIGQQWNSEEIKRRMEKVQESNTLVKNIPYGSGLAGGVRNKRWYERVYNNICEYQEWISEWGKECYRILKEGSFIMVFNSTRTIAHVQIGLEKVGFYARDILVWRRHSGIPKGYNAAEQLKKQGYPNYLNWKGWHSCLLNEWEAVCILQKPLINNYTETLQKNKIGLFKAQDSEGRFKSNIIENIQRDKKEEFNTHCTVKPVKLIEFLIKLVVPSEKNRIVLDPFIGSGTTAVAAINCSVSYIGFDINKEYCDIANERVMKKLNENKKSLLNFV